MYANAWDTLGEPSWQAALQKASADFEREVQPYYDGLLNGLSDFGHEVLGKVLIDNCKVMLRELSPIVDASGAPFSQHVRNYYLSYYLPRRALRTGGRA
jgi:hypothetical protein